MSKNLYRSARPVRHRLCPPSFVSSIPKNQRKKIIINNSCGEIKERRDGDASKLPRPPRGNFLLCIRIYFVWRRVNFVEDKSISWDDEITLQVSKQEGTIQFTTAGIFM